MKRLHWFVVKSFLGPFIMTFFICLFVLLMQFLWRYVDELVGKNLEWYIIAEFLTYASFALVPMAFPLAMLLASIMTFGNLGENYELVAMKSSGISLFRTMRPLIFIAILVACLAFVFANHVLPYTNLKFGALLQSVRDQKPEMIIKEGVFTNDISGYSIKVEEKSRKNNMLYHLMIYDQTKGNGNVSVLVSDSGTIELTSNKKYLTLTLYHGENYVEMESNDRNRHPFRRELFDKETINIPLIGFDFKRRDENIFKNHYKMMNLKQIKHQEDSLLVDYKNRLRRFSLQLNYNPEIRRSLVNETEPIDSLKIKEKIKVGSLANFDSLITHAETSAKHEIYQRAIDEARQNSQVIMQQENSLWGFKKEINKHGMERYKKFTWSFACLIFFFIGAPLGAIIRKGGLGMPVVVSVLMFIAYYVVSIIGEKFAREDSWSMFSGMMLSSFAFLPLGIFLTYKAATDSSIMNVETYQLMLKRFINLPLRKKKIDEDSSANQ